VLFVKSGHTSANSGMRTEFLFDDLFIQLQGSGRFLSSLRWRNPPDISSVTFDHDVLFKLPSLWRDGYPIQLTRSLLGRTTVEVRHSSLGFPLLPQLSAATELLVVNSNATAGPFLLPT
jgi:hypothetical protein